MDDDLPLAAGKTLTTPSPENTVRRTAIVTLLMALTGSLALAQPSPDAAEVHATRLIKLPNGDYTVPMQSLIGTTSGGKVMFHPQGPKTLVTVYVFGSGRHKYNFNLHRGSDCTQLGAQPITLSPAFGGQKSQTLVALPINNLTSSDYVVAARNALTRQQFTEACAHTTP
jgi:hypothetical protein